MADVSQLTADMAALQQAVADDQAAISSVQTYAQVQATQITNLEQQLASLQAQSGNSLDLSSLEASIAALKQQNQVLQSIAPSGASAQPGTTGAQSAAPAAGAQPASS